MALESFRQKIEDRGDLLAKGMLLKLRIPCIYKRKFYRYSQDRQRRILHNTHIFCAAVVG